MEAMPVQDMTYHYALVYSQTLPVAVFYFQEFDYKLADMNANVEVDKLNGAKSMFDKLKGSIASGFKNINIRLLIGGNAYISGEYGFETIPTFPKDNFAAMLNNVVNKVISTKKSGKKIFGVLVKDFDQENQKVQEDIVSQGYFKFTVDPNMTIKIPKGLQSFDDYMELFSSKYRVRAKSYQKKFKGVVSEVFSLEQIVKHYDAIQKLYHNVEEKAGFNLLKVPEQYFIELKKNLDEAFQFRAYFYEGQMVGFAASFGWKNTLEANFVGLDYEYNQSLAIYQNMLYDFVNQAISSGYDILNLGRTALEIKSTVGAEPDLMGLFVKSANPIYNRIVAPIFGNLKQTEWIQRRPFREEKNEEVVGSEVKTSAQL